MGCNSRTSYWDFPDSEEESILNFAPNVCFGCQSTEKICVGGLKLGKIGDLNNIVGRLKNPMASASSSGSYKRARAPSNVVQVPSCLVDGCVADLSNCRDYHRRHKVCEAHSKTPRVTIGGQEQRFCQQCSRFHSLGEFDDIKRSCRKRLEGHNRRRRKPQPDSLSLNSPKYIPAHQGSKFISYDTQYFPYGPLATSPWNDPVKVSNSQLDFKTNNFRSSFSQGYRGEKQFPFLQGADPSILFSQPHLNHNSTLGVADSSKLLFSDGFGRVTDSDRASSLLSSSQAETCGFNPTHFVQRPTQSLIPSTSYNGPAMESVLVADSGSNMECPEMIQTGSDARHQTISFSWS
ncbi:unnamed protein product [Rhodiola kirilowii]